MNDLTQVQNASRQRAIAESRAAVNVYEIERVSRENTAYRKIWLKKITRDIKIWTLGTVAIFFIGFFAGSERADVVEASKLQSSISPNSILITDSNQSLPRNSPLPAMAPIEAQAIVATATPNVTEPEPKLAAAEISKAETPKAEAQKIEVAPKTTKTSQSVAKDSPKKASEEKKSSTKEKGKDKEKDKEKTVTKVTVREPTPLAIPVPITATATATASATATAITTTPPPTLAPTLLPTFVKEPIYVPEKQVVNPALPLTAIEVPVTAAEQKTEQKTEQKSEIKKAEPAVAKLPFTVVAIPTATMILIKAGGENMVRPVSIGQKLPSGETLVAINPDKSLAKTDTRDITLGAN
jgi:hypothetical protein